MKIAVLGTGTVGNAIGSKLIQLGHLVMMGSRTAANEKAAEWVSGNGNNASAGTFADAAAFGEIIFNCTMGVASIAALTDAGEQNLGSKIIIDVSNPLDFSRGMPPTLTVSNNDSLGEQIQKAFPNARVVKTLNTLASTLMVDPRMLNEDHNIFICGNDETAKSEVKAILASFGWRENEIMDLGDITSSRGTEMYLPLWLRVWGATQTGAFNIRIVR